MCVWSVRLFAAELEISTSRASLFLPRPRFRSFVRVVEAVSPTPPSPFLSVHAMPHTRRGFQVSAWEIVFAWNSCSYLLTGGGESFVVVGDT